MDSIFDDDDGLFISRGLLTFLLLLIFDFIKKSINKFFSFHC
jgi:hypothetical protein